jgi:hypothetical protein
VVRKRVSLGREDSDLIPVFLNSVEYGLVSGVAEAAFDPGLFVIVESGAEALWTIVERIAERFMDTFQGITSGHEDLNANCVSQFFCEQPEYRQIPFQTP